MGGAGWGRRRLGVTAELVTPRLDSKVVDAYLTWQAPMGGSLSGAMVFTTSSRWPLTLAM
jgi:hypothetical protein